MANPALSAMRTLVEKKLLHYEIFQALDAGGSDFSADGMRRIKECVEQRIGERFGLKVMVSKKPSKVGEDGVPNV